VSWTLFELCRSGLARRWLIGEYFWMIVAPPVVGNRLALAGGSSPIGPLILGFWNWIVAAAVVLIRRTPRQHSSQPESA
jgi:hypothetical protein